MGNRKKYSGKWEEVESYPYFFRMEVPGGWIVTVELHDISSTCFVPDPEHEWILEGKQ